MRITICLGLYIVIVSYNRGFLYNVLLDDVDTTALITTQPMPPTKVSTTLENMTHLDDTCSSCCSSSTNINILSPVLSAIASALLVTVISVAVQISICKCRTRSKTALDRAPQQWKDHVYAEVERKEHDNPTYAEIGKSTEIITNNDAYGILK